MTPDDLDVGLIEAAGRCVDDGLLDHVVADVASAPGIRTEEIGGVTVYRDEQNAIFEAQGLQGMIAVVGDVVITLATANPQTFIDLAPFIEQFFAGQPR
jgi:hypothetical protein